MCIIKLIISYLPIERKREGERGGREREGEETEKGRNKKRLILHVHFTVKHQSTYHNDGEKFVYATFFLPHHHHHHYFTGNKPAQHQSPAAGLKVLFNISAKPAILESK